MKTEHIPKYRKRFTIDEVLVKYQEAASERDNLKAVLKELVAAFEVSDFERIHNAIAEFLA